MLVFLCKSEVVVYLERPWDFAQRVALSQNVS